MFLKVFGLLMKKLKKNKQLKNKPETQSEIPMTEVGSVSDSILKATVSVKGNSVYINIDGFLNEFDAMLWAKQQSVLWNKELNHYPGDTLLPTIH